MSWIRKISTSLVGVLSIALPSSAAADWPKFDHDSAGSGFAAGDTAITLTNIGRLHRRWVAKFDAAGDGAPILMSNVASSPFASQTLLFQETLAGSTYAIDAHTGTIVWKRTTGRRGERVRRDQRQHGLVQCTKPGRRHDRECPLGKPDREQGLAVLLG